MAKEHLYKLIREESVVLWAGAGLSIDAGYPSGSSLSRILFDDLDTDQRDKISPNLTLPDMAEEYIKFCNGNRNRINRLLIRHFIEAKPSSMSTYNTIANIPHFKNIVTTNYDHLFEKAYKGDSKSVNCDKDLGYINNKLPTIYRIHGDLESNLEGVIISSSDYRVYITRDILYKSTLTNLLTTNSVLFIGYSLADPNVRILLDKVVDTLGSHQNEMFLVAPKINNEQKKYLNSKGIQYIDAKAKKFINGLYQNIKDNISSDLKNGMVSSDTCTKFFNKHNIDVSFSSRNGAFILDSVKSSINNKDIGGEVSITPNVIAQEKIHKFISGDDFSNIRITKEDLLDFKQVVKGITTHTYDDIAAIEIGVTPIVNKVDIRFGRYKHRNLTLEIRKNQSKIQFKYYMAYGYIELEFDRQEISESRVKNLKLSAEKIGDIEDVSAELDFHKVIQEIFSGAELQTTFIDTNEFHTFKFIKNEKFKKTIQNRIKYLEALYKVEDYFNVRLKNYETPMEGDDDKVILLLQYIDKKRRDFVWEDPLEIAVSEVSEAEKKSFLKAADKTDQKSVITIVTKLNPINLFGNIFNIKYKVTTFYRPYLTNLEEIEKKSFKNFNAKFIGSNKKYSELYTDEEPKNL